MPSGYGPWPLTQAELELKQKYLKYDLPKAKPLMSAAGMSRGFSVNLSTFSTPLDSFDDFNTGLRSTVWLSS